MNYRSDRKSKWFECTSWLVLLCMWLQLSCNCCRRHWTVSSAKQTFCVHHEFLEGGRFSILFCWLVHMGKLPNPSHQYFFISLFLGIPCLVLLKLHMNVSSVPVECNHAAKSGFNKLVLNATTCKTTLIWLSPVNSKTHFTKKKNLREPFHRFKKIAFSKTKEDFQKEW